MRYKFLNMNINNINKRIYIFFKMKHLKLSINYQLFINIKDCTNPLDNLCQ